MKNKFVAAILALFLGGIGVHKFYLGKMGQGFVYLIFCLTFIPLVISFFEFLIYLTISEKEFDIRYNSEYMRNREYLQNK